MNLADFTKKAYGTTLNEILRVQIHSNYRLRAVVFSDKFTPEDELPNDFKLYHPLKSTHTTQNE